MDVMVVYSSQTGNTRKIANAIFAAIPGDSKDIQNVKEYQGKDANLFFVGFWTDKGDCDARIAGLLSGLHEKRVALFGTCGMGADESYYDQIAARVRKWLPADNIYLGCFFCQGKMPMQVRNRYESLLDGSDRDIHIRLMIRNFDEAMLHPDRKDEQAAARFAREIFEKKTE